MGKGNKGIVNLFKNRIVTQILIVLMIIVLLGSLVYVVFRGIIEIMETVLGEVLDFLDNPVSWLTEQLRHLHNTWVIAFRRG